MDDYIKFPWKKFFFDEFWEPIIILDSKYLIFDVNNKLLQLSGYKKEDLVGQSPNIILEQIFANAKSEDDEFERKIFTSRLISKVGLKIPIKISLQYFKTSESENNWYFFSFIKDISYETHLFRQLNATKSHALNTSQISSVVYRQTSIGPEVWYSEKLLFLNERFTIKKSQDLERDIKNEILKIGLILTTALGQGGAYTTGLSEIPIYDYDVLGVCFTKIITDKEAIFDDRLKNQTYMVVATFFPKSLSSLIVKRDELEKIFDKIFDPIDDIAKIDKILIQKMKKSIIKFEEVYDSVDFLF